ncbi:hypothetical protein [Streptomyces sp. NPDC048057]|uniref:hypothetical protein n=1 Tax=Streptomyces sp. NPDC048057 TaxID=3155628 RepID=UPI0033F478C6
MTMPKNQIPDLYGPWRLILGGPPRRRSVIGSIWIPLLLLHHESPVEETGVSAGHQEAEDLARQLQEITGGGA